MDGKSARDTHASVPMQSFKIVSMAYGLQFAKVVPILRRYGFRCSQPQAQSKVQTSLATVRCADTLDISLPS